MYMHDSKWDGTPNHAAVVRCFDLLEPMLVACASDHSLLIRKYHHDQPMWSFHFMNPKGGFGAVQIYANARVPGVINAAIAAHWWMDDHFRGIRASLSTHVQSLRATRPEKIGALLGETLTGLLGRANSELRESSRVNPGRRNASGTHEVDDFEQALRLPT